MSRISWVLVVVSLFSCTVEDPHQELAGEHLEDDISLLEMTPAEARACLSGDADDCPEIRHYTTGAKKPDGFEAKAFIECPDKINLPSSAAGWTGLSYVGTVNAHDALCWSGTTCMLSCQHVTGRIFEVYKYYYASQCYPEQTSTGTRFFECF